MKAFIAWICAYIVLFTWNPAFAWDFGTSGTGLPSQAGQNGKYLTTDGSTASWAALAGGGDMLAANNLSDVANAGTSRTNLGVAIGTNVQAWDADLDTYAGITPSANVQSYLAAATYAAMRALLDLEIGTDVQAWDADLDTYAGITPSANIQSYLGAADYSAMRTLLGLVIGTNVQAWDADLDTYAGITPSANVQSYLGAADYSAMRTLLGLVIGTNVQAYDADLTTYAGITPSANVQTLLGAATFAAFRSSLGLDTADNPQFATIELGAAADTTMARESAGVVSIEGNDIITENLTRACPNETPKLVSASTYTVGTTDPCECYGGVLYATTATTITMCDNLADEMNFTVIANVASTVIVDAQSDNSAFLDGSTIGQGDSVDSSGLGGIAKFGYYEASTWYIATDGWSDGGTN